MNFKTVFILKISIKYYMYLKFFPEFPEAFPWRIYFLLYKLKTLIYSTNWHISEVVSTHEMCQSLATHCI